MDLIKAHRRLLLLADLGYLPKIEQVKQMLLLLIYV
jgi:hypothetical protein